MTTGPGLCLPRFSTPRNLDRDTLGPQVSEVARRLGFEFMPWQRLIIDVAFEIDDQGRLIYTEVDVSVPRQSGKTAMTFARMVWRSTVAAQLWGPQRVAYTAQTHKMARRKLERDFYDMLKTSKSFTEVVNQKRLPKKPSEFRLSLNNGSEHVRFGTNSYLGIDAPSRSAGHGDVLDEGTIDEAFAHQDDDVEQAMLPAQATRFNPQIWVQSTAGDDKSFYWYRKILAGRAATGSDGPVAYFEWSIPDDADIEDPEVWWAHHPALGHTINEKFLRSQLDKARRSPDGEGLWRRAFGNQWVKIPVLEEYAVSFIPPTDWALCCDSSYHPVGEVVFAVDVTPEREKGHAAIVAADESGTIEVIDSRPGVGWLTPRAIQLGLDHRTTVIVDSGSPANSFADEWERAGVTVKRLTAREMAGACGTFHDAILTHTLRVKTDHALDKAAAGARKRESGDVWYWARRDNTVDVSPLVAASIARWAAIGPSAYENRGITVFG